MPDNRSKLREKIKEALTSVLPITAIVLLLCFTVSPIPSSLLLAFILGGALLIVGIALFTLGADTAMAPIGSKVGSSITKSKKLWLIILVSLLLGIIITISEPDLQVLANQIPGIPNAVLIGAVAVGVGVFLVIAMLRILIGIRLSYLLIIFYALIFMLAFFVPKNFWAIAFDSGGVTTGPMTVPFIMALGVGISSIRSDRHAGDDSFGLVALSSIGPVIGVLILGRLYPAQGSYIPVKIPDMDNSRTLAFLFADALPHYMKEVGIALAPILLFFLVFNFFALKMEKRSVLKILIGIVYTYVGLVLFLTGVNVGFMPVGNYVGKEIASLDYNWILIPISMVVGFFIVAAEPAVHVLNKQVEEMTAGSIPARAMRLSLSASVAVSLALSMIRVLTGISILWFLLPGYVIAIALAFFVPKIFTSIAFDSGGVASGPMTATFLLSFTMGACEIIGGTERIVMDAFGVIAMVAMTPLITIQILGVVYNIKLKRRTKAEEMPEFYECDDIIEL